MDLSNMTEAHEGISKGRMICHNRERNPAPMVFAASKSSGSILFKPASRISMDMGESRQTFPSNEIPKASTFVPRQLRGA